MFLIFILTEWNDYDIIVNIEYRRIKMKLSNELKKLLKDKRTQQYGIEGGWINDTCNEEFTVYLKGGYRFRSEECSFIHSEDLEEIEWSLKNDIEESGQN